MNQMICPTCGRTQSIVSQFGAGGTTQGALVVLASRHAWELVLPRVNPASYQGGA